jgi:hypothetical protein
MKNIFIAWEESLKVVEKLHKYFGGEIIGSTLLFKQGYLNFNLINDIDVLIMNDKLMLAMEYLNDCGYKEQGGETRFPPGYAILKSSLLFVKENHYPIHLCNTEKPQPILTATELIAEKFIRMNDSDYKQLLFMIEKKYKSKHPNNLCLGPTRS